jgi:hypothetical protein
MFYRYKLSMTHYVERRDLLDQNNIMFCEWHDSGRKVYHLAWSCCDVQGTALYYVYV